MSRILAIGDIHGCSRALDTLLAEVNPQDDDTVVALGDFIDRGPDSKGVLDRLIELYKTGRLVPLRGNHEVMLLTARAVPRAADEWRRCGGDAALMSYGSAGRPGTFADIPASHWEFLESSLVDWYESPTHFFVHANVTPDLPLVEQPEFMLHWEPLTNPVPHVSGKVMVCGHTPQRDGVPLNLGYLVCLDTWVYGRGWLTCLDVTGGRVWQANQKGERRTAKIEDYRIHYGGSP